ncbi:MAG: DUF4337 domain-containing protein [Pseudomonadota bacterium]
MAEEIETPLEHLTEEIHEAAEHAKENWLKWAALLSAVFAVMAAIAGLKASHDVNTAMIEQIKASDQWGYYQAKGIKSKIIESQNDILKQIGKPQDKTQDEQIDKYKSEQKEIGDKAEKLAKSSEYLLERHEVFSKAVTLFQVAIALIAITVLTKRRRFLLVSVALGVFASGFFIHGMII